MKGAIILCVLAVMGCQYDPHTWEYTKTEPKATDLVGVYVPDQATRHLVSREGHYPALPPSITLAADATVIITNIPDWWLTAFGDAQGGFDSGRGKWETEKHQNWWAIGMSFESTEGFASQEHRSGGLVTDVMLIGERPPYKLHLTVGDPDAGKAMQFEKAPAVVR